MSESPWETGRRVWERLARRPAADALDALSDVDQLRKLLDQVELEAVRDARRGGRSWTEIAVRLGVTRQSAWERWRELDERPGPAVDREPPLDEVVVPDVVGMSWPVAQHRLLEEALEAVNADPAAAPFLGPEGADFEVVGQEPAAGRRVARGSAVLLRLHRGPGSAPVRAPLPPPPRPLDRRSAVDEQTGETVTY